MEKTNLSFAGCGFLGVYHIGVASCIKEYAPQLLLNTVSGASIGALTGATLICNNSLGDFTSALLAIVYELRKHAFGAFNPLINVTSMLRSTLQKVVPDDAYKRCSGRLFISVTRVSDGANVIISEFKSNDDLIAALVASTFVPVFSGFIPPKVGEHRYVDGGFSNNLPILDENTITVSPFCGESDICPRDSSLQLFHVNFCNTSVEVSKPNMYRFSRILFPPNPEVLSMMCKQGFEDALKFLQRNNMINCTKCLAVQTTFSATLVRHQHVTENDPYDPECKECIHHRQKAAVSDVPETVVLNFEQAIQRANKGLVNWIFRYRGMKIVLMMGLPYMLGVDVIRAVLRKLMEVSPDVMENSLALSKHLTSFILDILNKMGKTGVAVSQKAFRKLDILSSYSDDNKKDFTSAKFAYESNTKIESEKKDDKGKVIYPSGADVSEDTYEHILDVVDHHDSLMAYYYMDDQNKVKVMEFYDVTNDEKITPDTVLHGQEIVEIRENNENVIESWTMGNDGNLATSYITPPHEQGVTEDGKLNLNDTSCPNSDPESEQLDKDNLMTLKSAIENDVRRPKRQRSLQKFPGLVNN